MGPARLTARLKGIRADAFSRTTFLLLVDNVSLGAFGVICSVLSTHLWTPRDVGTVAAVTGALGVVTIACGLGMPTTIVRFLGPERRQQALMRQAIALPVLLATPVALAIAFIPGHLGLPLAALGIGEPELALLIVLFATMSLVVAVGDPAWVARQEVSIMLAKDLTAVLLRVLLLVVVERTAAALFAVAVAYIVVAGGIDLVLLRRRLTHAPAPGSEPPLGLLRRRVSFALPTHVAIVVAAVPTYTLATLCAAEISRPAAAYAAVALQVNLVLTMVPSMTAQSLLADLSRSEVGMLKQTLRALRGAYAATLPIAIALAALAPWVLLIFGNTYATHAAGFLRWSAASSLFFVFNYVGDVVLLARHAVGSYVFVNVFGSICLMVLLALALDRGFMWLGPAWFTGQALYAVSSAFVLVRQTASGRRSIVRALRSLG